MRHERHSGAFIEKRLLGEGLERRLVRTIVRAVSAHHGRWEEGAHAVGAAYEKARMGLYDLLATTLGTGKLSADTPVNMSAFGVCLAGRIVLCDWIASNEAFFTDPRLQGIKEPARYLETAREVAKDWVARLGFGQTVVAPASGTLVNTPRPIQKTLMENDIPPGLVLIEAPMGEGKTEAAWILAEKWRAYGYEGMYVGLPTMAMGDSLFQRYRDDYLGKLGYAEAAKLVHGMAWLRDDAESDCLPTLAETEGQEGENDKDDEDAIAAAWFRPTRRAMLALHGVGTIDQAMLAAMHVKFGFLRLFGLAGRVLILDEVHAYDAYMSAIIERLLQWCACLRIPVVLLSATLSSQQRKDMIEAYGATTSGGDSPSYPLITVAEPDKTVRTISTEAVSARVLGIETHVGVLGEHGRIAEMAAEAVEQGGCGCVILNTVRSAQEVYRRLALPENEKLLFHARFGFEDRERITRQVLRMFGKDTSRRPRRFVLVATQVVEQSLDVDFDYMISEIAPIDLLLQRSGRLHRHRQRDFAPQLHVLLPKKGSLGFGGTSFVYKQKPLLRTLVILEDRQQVCLPDDLRELIEACYGAGSLSQSVVDEETIQAADQDWEAAVRQMRSQGEQFVLRKPKRDKFAPVHNDPVGEDNDDGTGWRAKTRLGANDRTAVLVSGRELSESPELISGQLSMQAVKAIYRRALRLPSYLPLDAPSEGYSAGCKAAGRLRDLVLLPVDETGIWRGGDAENKWFEVSYDSSLGLLVRRIK